MKKKMTKEEFIEKFLYDQLHWEDFPKSSKKGRKKSILPFKEETYLDIINLFREKWGEDLEVIKDKDVTIKYKGDTFNIKVIAKRNRISI